jgi:MFS family permease
MTTTTVRKTADERTSVPGRRRWLVLCLLAAAQLMLVLDVTVVNVALPDISAALHLDRAVIPWVMTAYTLAFGGLMLLGGRIADLVGARPVMLTGLAVFTASSLVCATAGGGPTLLAGRAAQGLGAAFLSPAALSLVTATFAGPARARALGVWGTLSAAGTAFGVTLGGLVTTNLGWQWIFAINCRSAYCS